MNLVVNSLPADLIRQVGYFVINMEALIFYGTLRQERVSYGRKGDRLNKSNLMVSLTDKATFCGEAYRRREAQSGVSKHMQRWSVYGIFRNRK
jgi:hypothetical protein